MKSVLIISDGKKGHLNQSIAFCRLKGLDYIIVPVKFRLKLFKLLSYCLGRVGFYTDKLYESYKLPCFTDYVAVVSTGSSTYYLTVYLGKKLQTKSIALMYPKGYRISDFTYVVAQCHDSYEKAENIVEVPLNLSYFDASPVKQNITTEKALAVIIGGDNGTFAMSVASIKEALDGIFRDYPDYLKYITTSRRTATEVEQLVKDYDFDYQLIYSEQPDINPIGDFMAQCEHFFITMDSTSMISEVRANSDAKITIIKLPSAKKNTKYHRLVETVESLDNRLDFNQYLEKIKL